MDHRLRMSIDVDEKRHEIIFGLAENPEAVASVSCAILAHQIEANVCVPAVRSRIYEEQRTERLRRATGGGMWTATG